MDVQKLSIRELVDLIRNEKPTAVATSFGNQMKERVTALIDARTKEVQDGLFKKD